MDEHACPNCGANLFRQVYDAWMYEPDTVNACAFEIECGKCETVVAVRAELSVEISVLTA